MEFALVVWVFLALVFGIIEFAYAIFQWSRVVDATRTGARAAIVNDMACGTMDEVIASCDDPSAAPVCTGKDLEGSPILHRMNDLMRQTAMSFEPDQVTVTYRCSSAGFEGREVPIPKVTVESAWVHTFLFPGIMGLDENLWSIPLPPYAATRLGEDLYTSPD